MIDVFFDYALRYDRDCFRRASFSTGIVFDRHRFQRASSREFVVREGLGWEPTILP